MILTVILSCRCYIIEQFSTLSFCYAQGSNNGQTTCLIREIYALIISYVQILMNRDRAKI